LPPNLIFSPPLKASFRGEKCEEEEEKGEDHNRFKVVLLSLLLVPFKKPPLFEHDANTFDAAREDICIIERARCCSRCCSPSSVVVFAISRAEASNLRIANRDDDREVAADGDMMSTLLLSRKKPSSLSNKVVRGFPDEDKMWWM